ncbi:lipopolysaccharide biosynthesis protein [Caballeronia calidae]|nr:oligosaccharide flippase family protein [Caballeronia calidae]
MSLRGATLSSRFVLLFFLARFMKPEDVGEYGLVCATIGYAMFVLGLDFYTYSTRELIASERGRWPRLLKDQAAFLLVCYAMTLPAILLVIELTGAIPWSAVGWFLVLLILEHLSQEFNRLLIAMSRPLLASVVLFVRSGAWCIVFLIAMIAVPEVRTLGWLFASWTCGTAVAVGIALFTLARLDWPSVGKGVDWPWIRRGLKVALPLLVATLALRVLFTADRYLERFVAGDELLGVYTFYVGVAGALMGFLDAAVFSFLSPRLIAVVRRGDIEDTARAFNQFRDATVRWLVGLATLCAIAIEPVLALIGKPIYMAHLQMFYLTLAGSCLFCLSMVPHYGLYAHREDAAIIAVNFLGGATFLAAFFVFASVLHELAVPVALICAFAFVCVGKFVMYRRLCAVRLAEA